MLRHYLAGELPWSKGDDMLVCHVFVFVPFCHEKASERDGLLWKLIHVSCDKI